MMSRLAGLLAGVVLLTTSLAEAHDGPGGNVGFGIGLGSPTGLTLELASARRTSFELALGVDVLDDRGGYLHLVWKQAFARIARGADVSVPVYFGVGGFIFDHDRGWDDDLDLGVRVPFGVNFDFQKAPVQIFVELAMNLALVHLNHDDHRWVGVGGYAGVRYWF